MILATKINKRKEITSTGKDTLYIVLWVSISFSGFNTKAYKIYMVIFKHSVINMLIEVFGK